MRKILIITLISFFSCKKEEKRNKEDIDIQQLIDNSIYHFENEYRDTTYIPSQEDSLTYFCFGGCNSTKRELINPNLIEELASRDLYYYITCKIGNECYESIGKHISHKDNSIIQETNFRDSIISEYDKKMEVKIKGVEKTVNVEIRNLKIKIEVKDSLFRRIQLYSIRDKDIFLMLYFLHVN